jgi:ribonuclease P protein component
MTGRIVRSIDFERVLGGTTRARSEHFAVHFVSGKPSLPTKPKPSRSKLELSTGAAPSMDTAVDESAVLRAAASDIGTDCWFGMVVPKRHAKRSVTRTLFKRQIRAAVDRHAAGLPGGLWVVRLRAPFVKTTYRSAASEALKLAARNELDGLFLSAMRRVASA